VRRPAAYYRHLLQFERSANAYESDDSTARNSKGHLLLHGSDNQCKELFAEGNSAFNSMDAELNVSSLLRYQHQLRKFSDNAGSRGPSYEASQIQILPEDACNLSTEAGAKNITQNSAVDAHALATITEHESGNNMIAARDGEDNSLGVLPSDIYDINAQQLDLRKHNSWCMRMHEVSTPEIAEVMAINAIAPFIMNARLKALMSKTAASAFTEPGLQSDDSECKKYTEHRRDGREYEGNGPHHTDFFADCSAGSGATGNIQSSSCVTQVHHSACVFIVNVSSMEGKFYRYVSTNQTF